MISILIPLYNGIEFLSESVQSVLDQTFSDWEILIGINGHPPQSDIFLQAQKFSSDKIHVFDLIEAKGVSQATNELAKRAKGTHIALLDVDDIWLPEKLEKQIPFLEYDVIGTKCCYFGEGSGEPFIPTGDISKFDFFTVNPIINSSAIIKKELATWREGDLQDYDLWLSLWKSGKKFYNVDEILVKHRLSKTSAFNAKGNHLHVKDLVRKHKKYFTVQLSGGLGNRLFQVAFGYALAKRTGYTFFISGQDKNAHSDLDYTNTYFETIPKMDLPVTKVESEPGIKWFSTCLFKEYKFDPDHVTKFVGNFQNESYFDDCKEEIISMFDQENNLLSEKYHLLKESYFLHVRRGDYAGHPIWDLDLRHYWRECLSRVGEKHVYIFSDDPLWCLENFSEVENKTIVVENESDSLWLMSNCKLGGICSNSSFSWWGAYLNKNPDKKIYFPDKWLNQVEGFDWKDFHLGIYPKEAILVPTRKDRVVEQVYFIGWKGEGGLSVASHEEAYQDAQRKGYETILVVEDGIIFAHGWQQIMANSIKDMKEDLFLLNAMGVVEWGSWGLRKAQDLYQNGAYVITRQGWRGNEGVGDKLARLQKEGRALYYFPYLAIDKKDSRVYNWMVENYKPVFGKYYDWDSYEFRSDCQIPQLGEKLKQLLGYKTDGTFVEVGAFDGVYVSNTFGLAKIGWNGLYIEPVHAHFELCKKNHANHPNVKCVNYAVGDTECLIDINVGRELSTISNEMKDIYGNIQWAKPFHSGQIQKCHQKTLDSILEESSIAPDFDILVIDVEGYELNVLLGFDILKWKPKVVIIELEDGHDSFQGDSEKEKKFRENCKTCRLLLEKAGYKLFWKDQINSIYCL